MKSSLFRQALAIAQRELRNHPQYKHYLHWSFVVKRNQIVEWATNTSGEPPKQFGYNARINEAPAKTHSEFNAYRRAKGIIKGNFELINVRLNRQGDLRNSAPCICCQSFLEVTGCTQVWHSTNEGSWSRGLHQ